MVRAHASAASAPGAIAPHFVQEWKRLYETAQGLASQNVTGRAVEANHNQAAKKHVWAMSEKGGLGGG